MCSSDLFPFLKTTRAFSPKAGSCLFLASWNIRILSQKRSNEALEKIASILLKYDFISILEVRDPQVIDRLCELLKKKGRSYRYELSPPVGNTIKERYCFLYDASLVRVLDLEGSIPTRRTISFVPLFMPRS